jgi:16S rRNA (cytidine1402-2'-O)-methyltransferase
VRRLIEAGARARVAASVVAELTGAGANELYRAVAER